MANATQSLLHRLSKVAPVSAVGVGPFACELLTRYAKQADCIVTCIPHNDSSKDALDALSKLGRFDLGVVSGALEHWSREAGERLLCRLRDLQTRQYWALYGGTDAWSQSDFLAFGLNELERMDGDSTPMILYGYDLNTYKQTPDWLNPKGWAHPERWNKFRW